MKVYLGWPRRVKAGCEVAASIGLTAVVDLLLLMEMQVCRCRCCCCYTVLLTVAIMGLMKGEWGREQLLMGAMLTMTGIFRMVMLRYAAAHGQWSNVRRPFFQSILLYL